MMQSKHQNDEGLMKLVRYKCDFYRITPKNKKAPHFCEAFVFWLSANSYKLSAIYFTLFTTAAKASGWFMAKSANDLRFNCTPFKSILWMNCP